MKETMQTIIFYISVPFIYLISILPFWVLYRISDFLYFIIFYVIKYRKSMVLKNLKISFPEKTEKEILEIRTKFYRFFTDLLVETIKIFTINKKQVMKHCKIHNLALLQDMEREDKDYIFVSGHYGNWELSGAAISLNIKHTLYVLYKPLSNKHFDRLIYNSRTRFGTGLIAVNDAFKDIKKLINKKSIFAFISDQAAKPEKAYWANFLNQDTPVFLGTEIIARKFKLPIIFVSVRRISRGNYEVFLEKLFDDPRKVKNWEITKTYTKKLEDEIVENPEIWLWTHNRWKHKKPSVEA